jgi:WD40 repeat protein
MESPMSGVQPLEPGDPAQVGAYRLLGRLGAGGMGQVFLGVSRGGRKVAVKVLRADLVTDAEFRARFAREVTVARTVNGFYTAPVVDADPDATPPWMVTAYVQGPSLAAAVAERGPLSELEVRNLAAALAEGLASIHAGGLVHRDLKPANIILAADGPRIIDFGIARSVGASTMTAKGTIIGTFTYMSPEQVMGLAAGPQSDVFSLGSVLVFAATGHGPFEAESLPAITHRILSQPPDLTGLPEALHDLVTRCLTKDRAKRLSLDELLTRVAAADAPWETLAPDHPATAFDTPSLATQGPVPAGRTQTIGPVGPTASPSNPPPPSVLLGTPGWMVTEIAFSPDGRLLAGSSSQGDSWRVFLWDAATRHFAGTPVDGKGGTPPKIAFSPDGQLLILKQPAATRLLSLMTCEFVSLSAGATEDSWRKVRFSPDGRLLATLKELRRISGFTGTQVHLWDSATLRPAAGPFKVDYVADDSTFAFSPDNRYLFYGHEGQGYLGDVTAPQPTLRKLKDLQGRSGTTSFSADGHLLATQGANGNAVIVLDTAAQTPVMTLASDRELTRLEFSPAAPLLATAKVSSGNEAIGVCYLTAPTDAQSWPTPSTGRYTASPAHLSGFQFPVADLRFSPDGSFLAATSRVSSKGKQVFVRIWAVGNTEPGGPLTLPGPIRMTFSSDSRFLAASCADQRVRLVSLRTASPVNVLPGVNAAFSPSAQQLGTTEPGGIRLWTLPE